MNDDEGRIDSEMRARFHELGRMVDMTTPSTCPTWAIGGAHTGRVGVVRSIAGAAVALSIAAVLITSLFARSASSPSIANSPTYSPGMSYQPARGIFTAAGSMTSPRVGATATLMREGQVLITGGWDGVKYLASAELFDPRNGTFRVTGSLPLQLGGQTATLLADGRVLVAGGFAGNSQERSAGAFLYNPQTGSFTATGSLLVARSNHSATLLSDGRVLLVGGYGSGYIGGFTGNLVSAEIYDPATQRFSATGSMSEAMWSPLAAPLANGNVLVVSSGTPAKPGPASAELYDPKTGSFTATGSMITGWATSATRLSDGRVLVIGGTATPTGTLPASIPSAEIYDPTTGSFKVAVSPPATQSPTLLTSGRILLFGGTDAKASAFLDAKTDTCSAGPTLTVARVTPTVTLLEDGSVLVVGGRGPNTGGDEPGPVLTTAEVFRP